MSSVFTPYKQLSWSLCLFSNGNYISPSVIDNVSSSFYNMFDKYSVTAKKFKRRNQKKFSFRTKPKEDQVKTNEARPCGSISIKPAIGHEGPFKARLGYTRNSWLLGLHQILYNIKKQMLVRVEKSESGFPECILTLYHMGSIDQCQVFGIGGSECLHLLSHLIFPKSAFCMSLECCNWSRLPNTSIVCRKSLRNLTLVDWA